MSVKAAANLQRHFYFLITFLSGNGQSVNILDLTFTLSCVVFTLILFYIAGFLWTTGPAGAERVFESV